MIATVFVIANHPQCRAITPVVLQRFCPKGILPSAGEHFGLAVEQATADFVHQTRAFGHRSLKSGLTQAIQDGVF
jgi:hypothetical protein